MWSRKNSCCINCTTTSRQHVAGGYCSKCYYLVRRLDQVGKWDLDIPNTLVGYPYRDDPINKETFLKVKRGYKEQIEGRLNSLCAHQEMIVGQVDGIYIEQLLRRVAKRCKVQHTNLLFGSAGYIDSVFNPDQKRALYGLLVQIEEDISWRVDLGKIFFGHQNEET